MITWSKFRFLEASYISAETHKAENPIEYFNQLKKG